MKPSPEAIEAAEKWLGITANSNESDCETAMRLSLVTQAAIDASTEPLLKILQWSYDELLREIAEKYYKEYRQNKDEVGPLYLEEILTRAMQEWGAISIKNVAELCREEAIKQDKQIQQLRQQLEMKERYIKTCESAYKEGASKYGDLLAKLQQAEADKERLDWMEAQFDVEKIYWKRTTGRPIRDAIDEGIKETGIEWLKK